MNFHFFHRKPAVVTLAGELARLERQAEARSAPGSFSRSLVASRSGVQERTLGAWIDGASTPKDFGNLMKVVDVLGDLSGAIQPPGQWQALWTEARKGKGKRPRQGSPPAKSIIRRAVPWVIGICITGTLGGFFALVGGDLYTPVASGVDHVLHPKAPAASKRVPQEELEAHAHWCCQVAPANASTGFYWPGASASALSGQLLRSAAATNPGLTPAGLGLVEIPLQTSSAAAILVDPPKVMVQSREPNLKRGMIAILPRGGQGTGSTTEYETDVDEATPDTVPYGKQSPGTSIYDYVSAASPSVITFFIADSGCDCTFDIKLTWQAQNHTYSQILTNNGQPFRIIGSAGLPWYSGDPMMGVDLKHVGGRPFSAYTG